MARKKYQYYDSGDDNDRDAYGVNWTAQTFTPALAHTIASVKLKLFRVGSPGTVTVSIRATTAGKPTGGDLAVGTINGNVLTEDTNGDWYEISFQNGYDLAAGSMYAIVVRATAGDTNNKASWRADITSPTYAGGTYCSSSDSGADWGILTGTDCLFEEWGVGIADPSVITWGALPKSQISAEIIEEAIARMLQDHEDDENAHVEAGESLHSHKAAAIIDHVVDSIIEDKIKDEEVGNLKIAVKSRAYTAVMNTIGPIVKTILRPNAVGSETNVPKQFPDSGEHYEKVDEASPDEDTTYVFSDVVDYGRDLYGLPNPGGAGTIYLVKFYMRYKLSGGINPPFFVNFSLRTHSTTYDYDFYAMFGITDSYVTYSYVLANNPNTGQPWTWAEIDALEIGCEPIPTNADSPIRITQLYAEVFSREAPSEGYADIQAAIDYTEGKGGGNILILPGTYETTKDIVLPDNITLVGFDPDSTIIDFLDENFAVKAIGETAPYTTGTISINSGSTQLSGSGTNWDPAVAAGEFVKLGPNWYEIESVDTDTLITLKDKYYGVNLSGETYRIAAMRKSVELKYLKIINSIAFSAVRSEYVKDFRVLGCPVQNNDGHDLYLKYAFRSTIEDNPLGYADYGIKLEYSTVIRILRNLFAGSGVGAVWATYGCSYIEIIGNTCLDQVTRAFQFYGLCDSKIINNSIVNLKGSEAIYLLTSHRNIIANNKINHIKSGATDKTIRLSNSDRNIIANNQFDGDFQSAINISNVGCEKNNIFGNIIKGNTGDGIVDLGTDTEIGHNIED